MTEDPTSSGKPSIIVEVERLFIAAGLTEEEAREAIFLIIETGADHAQCRGVSTTDKDGNWKELDIEKLFGPKRMGTYIVNSINQDPHRYSRKDQKHHRRLTETHNAIIIGVC